MTTSELRWGNIISKNGTHWMVNDIFGASGLVTVLPNKINESLGRRSVDDFRPAELTVEWLLKETEFKSESIYPKSDRPTFRFKDIAISKNSHEWFVHKYVVLNTPNNTEWAFLLIRIKHIHELQNFYFSATNTELKIERP